MITLVEKILVIQISQRKEREREGCERQGQEVGLEDVSLRCLGSNPKGQYSQGYD